MIRVDLHFHSICSDGSDSPEALVRLGRKRGVSVMSLTDHDTAKGVPAFLAACRRVGVSGISGVEISAEYPRTLHILGYNYDPTDAVFNETLRQIQVKRDERNVRILERLNELGIEITMEDVQKEAGKGVIGRPHFAYAMMRRGYVHSVQGAFSQYLGREGKAYVKKESLSPEDTIKAINAAGGVAVLAHPIQTCPDIKDLPPVLRWLKSEGLWGLECYSGHHDAEQVNAYKVLALANGLEMTAGSDYHGRGRPGFHFGVPVPETLLPWSRLGVRL